MKRENLSDIQAFILVAQEKSFTRASAKIGLSQSALSHTIRGLEERLGLRLLTRTTRSVSPTEAGIQLLTTVQPLFEEIDDRIAALNELKEKPAGTIRISTAEHAANTVLWPKLLAFLPRYPDITVEVTVDYGLIDIVQRKFDAGIRLGEQVAKDMIAVRISPDLRMAVVASSGYFAENPVPQTPQELMQHRCINLRLPTYDTLLPWEFDKDGHKLEVHVKGPLIYNQTSKRLEAALAGLGVTYIPEDIALPYIGKGQLVRVLEDWCAAFPGYYLYYPNRRQPSSAFTLLVNVLRYTP